MGRTGSYNLLQDYQAGTTDFGYASLDPYLVVCVLRLGQPLSFDRKTMESVTKDLTQGALLRNEEPLVITDDCLRMTVANHKGSHTKTMTLTLKQTDVNYLVEVVPDDWVFGWMMNNREDRDSVLDRIRKLDPDDPCNQFGDGLKFVGRVDDVYKDFDQDHEVGTRTSTYSMKCTAFRELDTQFFYDHSLASKDTLEGDIGQWLTRLGVHVEAIFGQNAERGIEQNNINRLIPTLLDLIVGSGPAKSANISIQAIDDQSISATPTLANSAPYAYMVPVGAGSLLGRRASHTVMAYADVMELLMGVQSYSSKLPDYTAFVPDLKPSSTLSRRTTPTPMLGTFLPMMPEFANRPLWSVLQQYLNPTVNEIYTALRVNPEGLVVPTIVVRQIPFTTDAFMLPSEPSIGVDAVSGGSADVTNRSSFQVTKFLDLPRWTVPATLVKHLHVGRSNATRVNFVHVYGQSSYLSAANVPIQAQMLENPPVRDDLDIMRSGLRPYMTSVECWVDDQIGRVPSQWIRLIADWSIGSHLTLNGMLEVFGVQAPVAEGDNLLVDGVVYHIMSVTHQLIMDTETGKKRWTTSFELCNGMRDVEQDETVGSTEQDVARGLQPIYPGFRRRDNTALDPGLTLEQRGTTGGTTKRSRSSKVVVEAETDDSQLRPQTSPFGKPKVWEP